MPVLFLLVALLVGASSSCGGKAIVDPEDAGGSTGGACDCQSDAQCPSSTACGQYSCQQCHCVLDPEPEGSACLDGYCDGEGECIDRARICSRACEVIPVCMTSTPEECYDFCFDDLSDCNALQLADTDHCTDELVVPECDGDAWLQCITPITCLSTDQPPEP